MRYRLLELRQPSSVGSSVEDRVEHDAPGRHDQSRGRDRYSGAESQAIIVKDPMRAEEPGGGPQGPISAKTD